MKNYVLQLEDFGFARCSKEELKGGTPQENARITRDILAGVKGPKTDAALMNAGAALYLYGKAGSMAEGIALAKEQIASGAALAVLEKLIAISNLPEEE